MEWATQKANFFLFVFLLFSAITELNGVTDINGGWSTWSAVSTTCSVSCGGGTLLRVRSCSNPTPQGAGTQCTKENGDLALTETKPFDCNMQQCWMDDPRWTDPSNCTGVCDLGTYFEEALCGNETCVDNQYQIRYTNCSTWNRTTCPNPCIEKDCPKYAVCKDQSDDVAPNPVCVCTMGYTLSGNRCIRPPPTKPTPRPIPTLPPEQKVVATVISKTASTVLIVCVSITLIFFIILRNFTIDRVIQMNMEIALLTAHLLLLFPSSTSENVLFCKILSIMLHLLFTACFMFMLLEALHMYSLVANVVRKDGMLTKAQNILVGWGVAAFVVLFTMCFEYDEYGGAYHCWLRMDENISMAQQVPIYIMMVITFTLLEAAGLANYKQLDGMDETALTSAMFSQRTNLIILILVYAHWLLGALSEYQQNIALYSIFSIVNAVLGVLVMVLHCSNNEKVRDKIKGCWSKVRGKKKKDDDIPSVPSSSAP